LTVSVSPLAAAGQAMVEFITVSIVPAEEASRRLRADHDLLFTEVNELVGEQLAATYHLASGPLGDFCESLRDLVAQVLMWDEINLAVLTEAAASRVHWSLDPRWETPEAGLVLNRSGVEAGRLLPASLLLHRLRAVQDAVLGELACYEGQAWTDAGQIPSLTRGIGGLAQKVWTVPGQPAFWHAAIHLNHLPLASRWARPESAPRS
jgi:hypothetical protein